MKPGHQYFFDLYHQENKTDAYFNTSGFAKLYHYAVAITNKDYFRNWVKKVRKKYNIPVDGYSIDDIDSWSHPFPEWMNSQKQKEQYRELKEEVRDLVRHYKLPGKGWDNVFEQYVFYNKLVFSKEPGLYNLCIVSESDSNKDIYNGEIDKTFYPVTLHISPYASKRDILNYIKDLYSPAIRNIQKKHLDPKNEIGKHRKRQATTRKMHGFIYDHCDMPRAELVELVHELFPDDCDSIDQGSIGKIISIEKKRRKEV